MGEIDTGNRRKELVKKINEFQKELDSVDVIETEKNISKLEEEKRHLVSVKNTILYLKENNRLLSAYVPDNTEKISVKRRNDHIEKSQEEKALNKNPTLLILMAISGMMAILLLTAWIEISGYRISLFELARETDNLTYMLGISESTQGIVSFLWIICILQWGFALCYIYIIYALYKYKESSLIYPMMFGVVIFFVVLWITTFYVNSSIDDMYSGLSNYVNAEMTWEAWSALILAVFSGGIYSSQEWINSQIFGTDNTAQETEIRKIPVINYYPWEEIQFTDVVFEKGRDFFFFMQYKLPEKWKIEGYSERWHGNIFVNADVILKVFRKEYVVFDQIFNLEWEHTKGATQKLDIEYATFNINDIDEVRVIIKSVEMPDGQKKSAYNVYAISDMNSNELERYREQIHYDEAVCREAKLATGWVCPCGYIHTETEKRCMVCGTAVSQNGKFIR